MAKQLPVGSCMHPIGLEIPGEREWLFLAIARETSKPDSSWPTLGQESIPEPIIVEQEMRALNGQELGVSPARAVNGIFFF